MMKKKNLAYKSKYNRKRKNQVVLLMITDVKLKAFILLYKLNVLMMDLMVL